MTVLPWWVTLPTIWNRATSSDSPALFVNRDPNRFFPGSLTVKRYSHPDSLAFVTHNRHGHERWLVRTGRTEASADPHELNELVPQSWAASVWRMSHSFTRANLMLSQSKLIHFVGLSLQTMNKVESRYVMESPLAPADQSSGSGMELWSAESELSFWPTARQLERKFLNVACRAVVLNESIYQRVASTNVTTASALTVQLQQQVQQRSRSSIPSDRSSSSGQVSASMASSHHSRDSYSLSAASKGTSVRRRRGKKTVWSMTWRTSSKEYPEVSRQDFMAGRKKTAGSF